MQIFHSCKAGCRQNLPGQLKVLKHIHLGIAEVPPSLQHHAGSRCVRWKRDDKRLRGFDSKPSWLLLMTDMRSGYRRQKCSPLKEGSNSSCMWNGVTRGGRDRYVAGHWQHNQQLKETEISLHANHDSQHTRGLGYWCSLFCTQCVDLDMQDPSEYSFWGITD